MMTDIAQTLAAASRSGTSQPPVIPQHRHKWPIQLGLLICLLFGHASLQAQVVASLPNIVLEADDRINAVVVQQGPSISKVIIGGRFTRVNGGSNSAPRSSLARLNEDGSIDQGFIIDIDGEVHSLVLDGTSLYVGGDFIRLRYKLADGTFADSTDPNLVRIELNDDPPTAHAVSAVDGPVKAIAVDAANVYIGGGFNNCGEQPQEYFCAIEKSSGSAINWPRFNDLDPNGDVEAIALEASGGVTEYIYLGGRFTAISDFDKNPVTRNHLAKLRYDGQGSLEAWDPNADDVVHDIVWNEFGTFLYIGGEFLTINQIGRARVAKVDPNGGVDPFWVPNADEAVYTLTVDGSNVYAGGNFTYIGQQDRYHAARLNGTDGLADSWDPHPDGPVMAVVPTDYIAPEKSFSEVYIAGSFGQILGPAGSQFPPWTQENIARVRENTGDHDSELPFFYVDATTVVELLGLVQAGDGSLYAGGSFSRADGQPIYNLLRVTPAGLLDTSWAPNPNSSVRTLALQGGKLYVGGDFLRAGGQTRNHIARLDIATGSADSWDPNANGSVETLAVDGQVVYVGGDFRNIGGQNRNYIARLGSTSNTNQADGWNPDADGAVKALVVNGQDVYVGGDFWNIGGQNRNYIARLGSTSNTNQADGWNPDSNALVESMALSGTDLYVGGMFTNIGGQSRNGIARLDTLTDTNQADSWNPGVNRDVFALTIGCEGVVYAGGNFSQVGTETRTSLARIGDTVTHLNCPLAVYDSATVPESGSAPIDVLANDSDVDGTIDATTVTIVTDVTNGTTSVNPTTGVVTYTHDGSETTSDSFTYAVDDDQGVTSNITTVSITVTEVNDPPVAVDDSATVAAGGSVPIDVVANDSDVDGTIVDTTVTIVTQPANGSTSVDPKTDERTYTHNGSLTLSDSFTYTVDDDQGATSNVATVSITVTHFTTAPVANDDSATVDEAGFVLIDVLSNDTDAEGNIDPTTVAIVGTPANGGTAVDAVTGEVTYTHDGSETLSDSFTYTVNDLSPGWTSNAATVSITVNAVNDPPVAVADAYATDADTQLSVSLPGVLATDTDAEGGPLTAVLDTDMSYGTLSFNADGSFTYDPTPGFNGESSFTYYANDGTVNSAAPATVTITVGTSCGSGVDIIGGDWTMISLPCDPGIFNQVGDLYGDELGISAYGNGNEWLMYDYNPSTNSYGLLGISSQLKQDMGYWILSDNSAHLDIEGNLTPIVSSTVCDDIDTNVFIEGCIEVYLTPPPPGTPLRWNLVGNPFPYPIAWKDVRILVDVEVLNATEAQGSGYGQKNIQIYENGSTYSPYDDQTPGMEGVLNPGQAFWYAATDDTVYNIRLLFPAKPHTTGMTLPSAPDYRLFAGAWTVLREVADFVVPSAHADKPPDKGKPPKDDNPGHQRREARLQGREWYVRLIAEWPEGGLKDRGNVLGQLADSELGFDAHDLQEMSPFSTPYLTIVFPHDDWGEKSGNYASDYHPLSKGKSRGDAWQFEVRTDQPGREITLRWVMQGEYPQEPLLINVETGETVAVDPAVPGSYTFVMDGTTQRFEWMY